ncbi:hypothetical protein [Actinomadura sp. 6N118]|uniref:DUF4760 domain-containing protein n=1 Tax=Actinomadura sp. 6N118 TaxID=3375151 RepID=UPI0037B2DBF3
MARQNLLPVALEAFREARTPEWFEARDWIIENLAAECPPDDGVSALPPGPRAMVRKVGFFYDNLGVFVAYQVVAEGLVIGFFGQGMNQLWQVLEPYIRREGEIRQMRYMVFFEDLVRRYRRCGPAEVYEGLGLGQAPDDPAQTLTVS